MTNPKRRFRKNSPAVFIFLCFFSIQGQGSDSKIANFIQNQNWTMANEEIDRVVGAENEISIATPNVKFVCAVPCINAVKMSFFLSQRLETGDQWEKSYSLLSNLVKRNFDAEIKLDLINSFLNLLRIEAKAGKFSLVILYASNILHNLESLNSSNTSNFSSALQKIIASKVGLNYLLAQTFNEVGRPGESLKYSSSGTKLISIEKDPSNFFWMSIEKINAFVNLGELAQAENEITLLESNKVLLKSGAIDQKWIDQFKILIVALKGDVKRALLLVSRAIENSGGDSYFIARTLLAKASILKYNQQYFDALKAVDEAILIRASVLDREASEYLYYFEKATILSLLHRAEELKKFNIVLASIPGGQYRDVYLSLAQFFEKIANSVSAEEVARPENKTKLWRFDLNHKLIDKFKIKNK